MDAALPGDLPAEALPAFQAYRAMEASKARHFQHLERMQQTVAAGGRAGLAEKAMLDSLLSEHDACVKAFSESFRRLAADNPGASQVLMSCLSTLNASLGRAGQAGAGGKPA